MEDDAELAELAGVQFSEQASISTIFDAPVLFTELLVAALLSGGSL